MKKFFQILFVSLFVFSTLACDREKVNPQCTVHIPVTPSALSLQVYQMRNGLLKSEVALSTYILNKKIQHREERTLGLKEMSEAYSALLTLSRQWEDRDTAEELADLKKVLADFRLWQDKVETIVHSIDNTPALKLFYNELSKTTDIQKLNLKILIREEIKLEANKRRKYLLAALCEQERSLVVSFENLRSYLVSHDVSYSDISSAEWVVNSKNIKNLMYKNGPHFLFTNTQLDSYKKYIAARKKYEEIVPRILAIELGKHPQLKPNMSAFWWREELAPRAKEIHRVLNKILKNMK